MYQDPRNLVTRFKSVDLEEFMFALKRKNSLKLQKKAFLEEDLMIDLLKYNFILRINLLRIFLIELFEIFYFIHEIFLI